MGGFGSGRYFNCSIKDTVYKYPNLDIREIYRGRSLSPGVSFSCEWKHREKIIASIKGTIQKDSIIVKYGYGPKDKYIVKEYAIIIERTKCAFGGMRPWFLCPNVNCGKRVAILYGGEIFVCRHCRKLAYLSQRKDVGDRAARRAEKIRTLMGWEPGILNEIGVKPKGMHWKTFRRLRGKHNEGLHVSMLHVLAKCGKNN
jgi:hypothetical protein